MAQRQDNKRATVALARKMAVVMHRRRSRVIAASILLVDDHPVVREGYRRLIEQQPGLVVVAEAESAAAAYHQYKAHAPDLVILDLSLPGPSGIQAIGHIRQWDGAARILVFSMHTGAVVARQAFAAGASGYVSKASPPRQLLTAVAAVLRGERTMSADIARVIAQDEVAGGRSALDELSPRELEILNLTAGGMTAQAVAEALCLSLKTVHNNLSVILAMLGARTDAHIVWVAIRAGLVLSSKELPLTKL